MNTFREVAADYLSMRQALGFDLRAGRGRLFSLASFLDQERTAYLTVDLAVRWATERADASAGCWRRRLSVARGFGRHLAVLDPRTEIPPTGLLPSGSPRPMPYIYTDEEIRQLIEAARNASPQSGLEPKSLSTLFGLLAVTGIRIGEATALDREDVDLTNGVLHVKRSKFGKSRLVPVHETTSEALRRYAMQRDQFFPYTSDHAFFLYLGGQRLKAATARWRFLRIARQIGCPG